MGNVSKKKHIFYNLNRKKKRSGKKYEKAINWVIFLLKRKQRDGDTLWIQKTMKKAEARMKKYGITRDQILSVMDRKGVSDLASLWK